MSEKTNLDDEHDKWFRAQVAQGLAEADDPNTQWVSQEEAEASWAKKRSELLERAERLKFSRNGGQHDGTENPKDLG